MPSQPNDARPLFPQALNQEAAERPAANRDPNATTGAGADSTRAGLPPTGTGRYALGEEIARGGMGVIWRATDTTLDREVAVKVLMGKFAPDSGIARRFAAEARITGQLKLRSPLAPVPWRRGNRDRLPRSSWWLAPRGRNDEECPFILLRKESPNPFESVLSGVPKAKMERGPPCCHRGFHPRPLRRARGSGRADSASRRFAAASAAGWQPALRCRRGRSPRRTPSLHHSRSGSSSAGPFCVRPENTARVFQFSLRPCCSAGTSRNSQMAEDHVPPIANGLALAGSVP